MMLRKTTRSPNLLAATLLLGTGVSLSCGGTTSPEPPDNWEQTACESGLISGAPCDGFPTGAAGMQIVGMAGGGMGGMMMPDQPGPVCDAVETIFKQASPVGCAGGGCHGTGSNFGAFADEPAENFLGDGVDACAFIDTTTPENSKIYARMSGEGPCAGGFMPLGASGPYEQEGLDCVLSWVSQFSDAAMEQPAPVVEGGGDEPAVGAAACDAPTEVFALAGPDGGCAGGGCHSSPSNFGGFVDEPPEGFLGDGSAGCAIVDTTNPENSSIYGRMTQQGDCGGGNPMPFGQPASSQEQIDCVLSWLTQFQQ